MTKYTPPTLPIDYDFSSKEILVQLIQSHKYLAELRGIVQTIPNQSILISSLVLQEAKDSSEIENIITTHDELYKSNISDNHIEKSAAKEVQQYTEALGCGYEFVTENHLLLNSHIKQIQAKIEKNNAGFRTQSGTTLKNNAGEVIYTPPQSLAEIEKLMSNLEEYINNDGISNLDPLVKVAIIHHQFETIHPFFDGNGRTGRIIIILYLVAKQLLQIPILYLSRYIVQNKQQYYFLLQHVRDTGNWDEWVLYILRGIELTAKQAIEVIKDIKALMSEYKHTIRQELPKIYSQELLNSIFRHPYTKIDFFEKDLGVTRKTAAKYLTTLTEQGLLVKQKYGKYNYYINTALLEILENLPNLSETQSSYTEE